MHHEASDSSLNVVIVTSRMKEVAELSAYLRAIEGFSSGHGLGRISVFEPGTANLRRAFKRMNGTYQGIFVDNTVLKRTSPILIPGIKEHGLSIVLINYGGSLSWESVLLEEGIRVIGTIQPSPFFFSREALKKSLSEIRGLRTPV